MSTFAATFKTRDEYKELFANWPFWGILSPNAYDFAAYIPDAGLAHIECAFTQVDAGEADAVEVISLDQPMTSGESCIFCDEWVSEPYCQECTVEHTEANPLMISHSGEHAICRRDYLTGLLRGTLGQDKGAFEHYRRCP